MTSTIAAMLLGQAFTAQYPGRTLPIDNMQRHPFLMCGRQSVESGQPIIKQALGESVLPIRWSAAHLRGLTSPPQEFLDATVLSNGNLIFAKMTGAGMASPKGQVFWTYHAPDGTEVDSIQCVGKDRVLVMQNGIPAKALIFDTQNKRLVRETIIPTTVKVPHDMFRHVRMTQTGTLLVPHLAENKVCEYDLSGKLLWMVSAPSPWSADRLPNGITLIAGDWHQYAREVDPRGMTVWEFSQKDLPNTALGNIHVATRLSNGNTLLGFWFQITPKMLEWPGTVEVLELTRAKKVVWVLSSWQYNDFADYIGPINSIQLLDQAVLDENVFSGG